MIVNTYSGWMDLKTTYVFNVIIIKLKKKGVMLKMKKVCEVKEKERSEIVTLDKKPVFFSKFSC